jgi:hypothetical protein
MGLYQTKELQHSKGNNQQNEKSIYRKGKIFSNHTSNKGLISKIIYKEHTWNINETNPQIM